MARKRCAASGEVVEREQAEKRARRAGESSPIRPRTVRAGLGVRLGPCPLLTATQPHDVRPHPARSSLSRACSGASGTAEHDHCPVPGFVRREWSRLDIAEEERWRTSGARGGRRRGASAVEQSKGVSE